MPSITLEGLMRRKRSSTPINIPRLLTPRDVSERLGVRSTTLKRWRIAGGGPPYVKFGRIVRYPEDRFEAWLAVHLRRSTRAPMGAA